MSYPVCLTFDVLSLLDIVLGLLVNAFITVVNLVDWSNGRRLKPCDKILISKGLSRFFVDCVTLCGTIIQIFNLQVLQKNMKWIVYIFQMSFDYTSLWFSMWLCFLYYVKISIFKNPVLLRIKLRASRYMIPVFTLTSIISFSSGFMHAWDNRYSPGIMCYNRKPQYNITLVSRARPIPSFVFGHVLPFILVTVTSSLLICSIVIHVKRIKSNSTSFTTPNTDAHRSAIRSVYVLQMFTTFNFIANVLFRFSHPRPITKYVSNFIIVSYPAFHSLVLVFRNSKLHKTLVQILVCIKAFFGANENPKSNLNRGTIAR